MKKPKYKTYDFVIFYEGLKTKNSVRHDMLCVETGEKMGSVEFFKDSNNTYVYSVLPSFKRENKVWRDLRKFILDNIGHDIAKF